MKKKDIQEVIEVNLGSTYQTTAYFEYTKAVEVESLQQNILGQIKCNHCGWCCSNCNVLLTDEDIITLCRFIKVEFNEFYDKYMDKEAIMNYLEIPCPFLSSGNGCKIYEARPKVCRNFPFNGLLLNVDPCEIGKNILKIIDNKIADKMLAKMNRKALKKFEEKLRQDKIDAEKTADLYDNFEVFLPKFNEDYHKVAVIDKEMLQKIEKELIHIGGKLPDVE